MTKGTHQALIQNNSLLSQYLSYIEMSFENQPFFSDQHERCHLLSNSPCEIIRNALLIEMQSLITAAGSRTQLIPNDLDVCLQQMSAFEVGN